MSSRSRLPFRALVLGVSLLLMVGLLAVLFSSARAITITWNSPTFPTTNPESISGPGVFTVNLEIPSGQKIPIESVGVVVEQETTSGDKFGAALKTHVTCSMQIVTNVPCTSTGGTVVLFGGTANIITQIELVCMCRASTGAYVDYADVFTNTGAYTFTADGYGYDSSYGYGRAGAGITSGSGTGQAYGYSSDTISLRFQITVSPAVLSSGFHYLTFLANTGSPISSPTVSSPALRFGVGGGGGGAAGGAGGAGGGTASVTAGQSSTEAGASATYTATYSGSTTVSALNVDLPAGAPVDGLTLTFSTPMTGFTVTVNEYAGTPPGATLPAGVDGVHYFSITVSGAAGGAVSGATFTIVVPLGKLASIDVTKLVLVHFKANGATEFVVPTRGADSGTNAQFTASVTGLSPFALVQDKTVPVASITVPTGTLTGMKTLTLSATDNLRVSKIELRLDGVLLTTIAGASGSYSWDTSKVSNGAHTLEAKAFDLVSNTGVKSASVNTNNEDAPQPTGSAGPGPGAGKGGAGGWVVFFVVVAIIIVIVVGVVVARRKKGNAP